MRIAALLISALLVSALGSAQTVRKTRNLVLVTVDGLRWQEVFRGMDPALENRADAGMADAHTVRQRFGGETPIERRRRLLPFLSDVVAQQGALLGNRDKNSRVELLNRHRFSYPGYSEILTGKQQDEAIASNAFQLNPSITVLQILQFELQLPKTGLAVFASWEIFRGIVSSGPPDSFVVNAGYQDLELDTLAPQIAELSRSQHALLTPWRTVRHDYHTFELALEYLRLKRPRVLYLALGEPDDWAHEGRYDRGLETARYFDECLERLWAELQSISFYQGSTTMLVTTDHGRGRTPEDWTDHGADVDGAQEAWIAAIGPDTPALGEAENTEPVFLGDIAPTMLALLGLDYLKLPGVEGDPLALIAPQ